MFLKEYDERLIYFNMKKLKTRNIVGYEFRLKYVLSELFLQLYIQLFIMESLFEIYFMISCYYVHDRKLLYVYDN